MYLLNRTVGWLLFTNALRLLEGRVYCQDAHASPWIPLGYSCPVMCQNILSAIEKLKVIDYKKVLDDDRRQRLKMNDSYSNSITDNISSSKEHSDKEDSEGNSILYTNNKHRRQKSIDKSLRFQQYLKVKENKQKNKFPNDHKEQLSIDNIFINNNIDEFSNVNDKKAPKQVGVFLPAVSNSLTYFEQNTPRINKYFEIEAHKSENIVEFTGFDGDNFEKALKEVFKNRTCDWFKSKQPYILIKKVIRKCNRDYRRKGYGEDFLRTLTRTMNRFSKVSFEFTEDMVELVLERVFGKNVELRDNIFDVDKLLRYLRNAMAQHRKDEERGTIIVLKPRHCLSVSMPGCFCKPGFVESSGQCVKPADCVTDSSKAIYLTRIIVH